MEKYREATATRHMEQMNDLATTQSKPETLCLGASYFERLLWCEDLKYVRKILDPLQPAILAKGGDKAEHLNWRINHLMDNLPPTLDNLKRIVICIGLNNWPRTEGLVAKIQYGIDRLRSHWPNIDIYVEPIPITPSNVKQSEAVKQFNSTLLTIRNAIILDDALTWAGINTADHFIDEVHLNAEGYRIWLNNLTAQLL